MRDKTIEVGDVVRFTRGVTNVAGRVTEDRGPLGFQGQRLFRVAYSLDPEFSNETEIPADKLRVVRKKGGVEIGDVVRFTLGRAVVTGRVTQQRGRAGVRKRRLYRIVYKLGDDFEAETELPEGDFDIVWNESVAE